MEMPNAGRRARATIRRPQPVLAGGILALAALALAACAGSAAPSESTEPAAPTPAETSSADPEPEAGTQPASRYPLTCDDLVPAQAIADMFDVALEPVDPLVTAGGAGISVPRMTSILSIGGLACEWSNGEPANSQYGANPAYAGVLVTVLPPQDAGWSAGATDAGMPSPGDSCGATNCTITRVGSSGAWIELSASAGPSTILPPGAAAVADAAATAVDSAGPPAPATAVDASIPADCETLVPTSAVETLTGTSGLVAVTAAGGWSDWAEARSIAGDTGCMWQPSGADENIAAAAWVRGGLWAFERIEAGGALVPAPSELAIVGADRAVLRCDATYAVCGVDLLVGSDWLQVTAPIEEHAVSVATEVASRLDR
jgi:hypothetical protein